IMKNNNCRAGVNGGFYDKEGNPIGLFMSNNNYLGDILVNHPFFNGFFVGIDDGGLAIEGEKLPERGYSFILQSGPLMDGWKPTKLSIINDEAARRVVVVETTRKVKEGYIGEKYFMVLYDPDSHFSGPYLSQVPLILAKLQEQMGTQITLSLNLDGGGASAFYNDNIKLEELSPVGSFFCLL
ncbi:phosphodiester glycosidase family protein, partial [Candidatus Gottesmanbacteria bacterium]|nr:phosphodiester glycosidase family protein [Candidatus Gottesmanbacteria bacterium]